MYDYDYGECDRSLPEGEMDIGESFDAALRESDEFFDRIDRGESDEDE